MMEHSQDEEEEVIESHRLSDDGILHLDMSSSIDRVKMRPTKIVGSSSSIINKSKSSDESINGEQLAIKKLASDRRKRRADESISTPQKIMSPRMDRHGVPKIKKQKLELTISEPQRPTKPMLMNNDWLNDFADMQDSSQRKVTLTKLTEYCSHEELVHLLSTIEVQLKRDFVALLPAELSIRILNFLSARDLLACAQVSSRWCTLSGDDLLWQQKCREAELELPPLAPNISSSSLSSTSPPRIVAPESEARNPSKSPDLLHGPGSGLDSDSEDLEISVVSHVPPHDSKVEEEQEEEEGEEHPDEEMETPEAETPLAEAENHTRFVPAKAIYLSYCQLRCHWRNGTRNPPHVSAAHENHVITCLEFYKNLIISASDDSTIELRNARTYELVHTLRGHFGGIWSSAVVERFLVTGSTDRTLRVWDLENLSCVAVLTGHVSTVRCLASSGKRVVSGSRDTNLRVWDVVNVRPICLLEGHRAAVRCVQFRENVVVSGSYDSTVRVWDVDKKQCLYTLDDHVNRVYTLLFDGDFIISGSLDTTIRVYNFHTGSLWQTLYGHQSLTSGMVLRKHQLISSNADGTVRVWDIRTGESSRILSGEHRHTSAVTCVQLVMNFVVSAGDDGAVKLWDVQTGHFIRDLVRLDNSGRGGVVWRILANRRRLVCAAGSRNGAETTKLLLFDFEPSPQLHRHRCEVQGDGHCYRDPAPNCDTVSVPTRREIESSMDLPEEEEEETL